MCFWIEEGKEEPMVAQEDIIVYKYLRKAVLGGLISPLKIKWWTFVNKFFVRRVRITANQFGEVHKGYHSYNTKDICWRSWDDNVYELIIPKGTKYYENSQERVSERLLIKSFKPVKTKRVKL